MVDNERPLDWWVLDQWADHAKLRRMVAELNRLYRGRAALVGEGFQRRRGSAGSTPATPTTTCFPSTGRAGSARPVRGARPPGRPCPGATWSPAWPTFRLSLSSATASACREAGRWLELLNTDANEWGGSGLGNMGEVWAQDIGWHGQPHSAEMVLPPLAVLWLVPAPA